MRHLKKSVWPHCVTIERDDSYLEVARAEKWAKQTLGKEKHKWIMVSGYAGTHFYFKEGRDATLFSLSCL